MDRRLTAGLLALLLGFIVAIASWGLIWPNYRGAGEPPSTPMILWSLLILAAWIVMWVGVLYWALSRRR